jgi:transposase
VYTGFLARLHGEKMMAQAYGDDLRRKFLSAYDQGEETLEELASRFLVSVGWAKKISAQRNRTGHAERVRHRPGRKPHAGVEAQQKVTAWIGAKPDLTLSEIQIKLSAELGVRLSLPQIWHLLRKLGLRLKKSHSTPASEIRKPTASGAKSSSRISARSRRSG